MTEFVEPVEPEKGSSGPPRRLTRSRSNKWLAGVCGGLAEYFSIDPVLVRIIFAVLAFTGAGFPIYVAAWVIVPMEDETHSIGDSLVRRAREGRNK